MRTVDLWTDTVDPEDYISLLYCITHCLTYLRNERHVLKSLEDVSNVDILEKSKGVTLEVIKQDLQRELTSEAFKYYRDQIKIATKTPHNAEQGSNERTSSRRQSRSKQRGNENFSRTQSRGPNEPSSPRRQSHSQQGDSRSSSRSHLRGANDSGNTPRRQSLSQQGGNERPSVSQSSDRKLSLSRSDERDGTVRKNSGSTPQPRQNRSGSGAFGQNAPRHKFSVQVNTNALNLTAAISGSGSANAGPPLLTPQNHPTEVIPVSPPRRPTGLQRATSPNMFSRGGGVVLNIGMMDGMMISKSIADGKPGVTVSTSEMAAFPRRRSRSASNSSQHRRDQIMQAVHGKNDSPREPSGLHVSHIEASGSTLRTGSEDPNAPGLLLTPGAAGSGTTREPFTVRAAAVAEAAANMAVSAADTNSQHTFSSQRTLRQLQQHMSQSDSDGTEQLKNTHSNVYTNNSSLTAPLVTIISSKTPMPREVPSINKINLQLHEMQATRTPHEGRPGVSVSSPRVSNAISAQAIGIFISSHQQPAKPPISPRSTLLGSILSNDHQPPRNPTNLQQHQPDESQLLAATEPVPVPATAMSLTISGKPAAPYFSVESVDQHPSKLKTEKSPVLLKEGSIAHIFNGVTRASPPKDDLKALLSPRYVVSEPVVSYHSTPISTLKQSSVQPPGSTRALVGIKTSPRVRHHPSSLANGPARSYLQQHRQQRPSELQELVIAPKLG
ncbi:hypothetical protein L914_18316 [Phytophthora nicotianae]|uniref:Uncharacterized protein n=1 Tax=Phytophthora nicotianae TaxID=4792 RepID=W2MG62_PHYNI|nr:hypothetical protein L914_18316 [Phytophthora nicotianae]